MSLPLYLPGCPSPLLIGSHCYQFLVYPSGDILCIFYKEICIISFFLRPKCWLAVNTVGALFFHAAICLRDAFPHTKLLLVLFQWLCTSPLAWMGHHRSARRPASSYVVSSHIALETLVRSSQFVPSPMHGIAQRQIPRRGTAGSVVSCTLRFGRCFHCRSTEKLQSQRRSPVFTPSSFPCCKHLTSSGFVCHDHEIDVSVLTS